MSPARSSRGAWPLVLAAPLALAALARPLANPDLFWHLATGRWILHAGTPPRVDPFSWTRSGAPWVDFEWLSQVLYAAVHSAAGWAGLWALKMAVLAAALAVLVEILREQGQDASGQALGLLAAAAALVPSADARPENFSLLFFVFQLGWLEHDRRSKDAAGAGRLIAAALFYALWANLHGGWAFGLALIACYAVGSDLTKFAPLACAAAAGTLANPYGIGAWAVLLEHGRQAAELRQYVVEWQPVTLRNSFTWPFWLLLWLTPAAIGLAGRQRRSIPRAHLFALAGLGLACAQTRNTPYFCLAASVYLPRMAGRIRPLAAGAAWALCAVFLALWVLPGTKIALWSPQGGWPERAAGYLQRQETALAGKPLYHPYGWGGYLENRLWPDYKVFWDGRYLFADLLGEERKAQESPKDWNEFLDKHGVDLALLEHAKLSFSKTGEDDIPRPFYVYFMPQKKWALVHWDDEALLFVRRSAVSADWLAGQEFQLMRPGDEAWVRHEIDLGVFKREDLRHDTERIFAAPDLTPKRKP